MDAFLDRFYDEVDDCLADPHSQKRITKAMKYRDLYQVQQKLFERILCATGNESLCGYAEAEIELVVNQEFYSLPPEFRQFIFMEKRLTENPRSVQYMLPTIPPYSEQAGIEIQDSLRGFRIQPIPSNSDFAATWTMGYLKGPVKLHNATATKVYNLPEDGVIGAATYALTTVGTNNILTWAGYFTPHMVGSTIDVAVAATGVTSSAVISAATYNSITFPAITGIANADTFTIDGDWCWLVGGTPATDEGEVITINDYYNGSLLRVYSATLHDPQTKEIMDYTYDVTGTNWHYKLRHPWSPAVPTATVLYEICPEVPLGMDSIYAYDVAIMNSGRRSHITRRAGLLHDRHELFSDVLSYYQNKTMDRAPARVMPQRYDKVDPYFAGVL